MNLLEQYVEETLGIAAPPQPWGRGAGLPQYLRQRYRFFRMDFLGVECVLMADAGEGEQPPAVVGKHLDQVRSRCGFEPVYVRPAVTSYNRKRLVDRKVPFIVPGNQLYLPMLGIDLREHLKRLRERKPVFRPATQALILLVLWRQAADTVTPAQAARRLGYSPMTMTRAFDELEAAEIGEQSVRGKERRLHLPETGRRLWEKVLPHLITPVRKRLFASLPMATGQGKLAGQSALARYTLLAEPNSPVVAFPADIWRTRSQEVTEMKLPEPEAVEVELWKYPPSLFSREESVDRLSLYLSMRDTADERVQSALDALLEGMPW